MENFNAIMSLQIMIFVSKHFSMRRLTLLSDEKLDVQYYYLIQHLCLQNVTPSNISYYSITVCLLSHFTCQRYC